MAYFRKLSSGSTHAEVKLQGITKRKTFKTKREAQLWAADTEAEIRSGKAFGLHDKSFQDAIDRYITEECPQKPGCRWEVLRLQRFAKDNPELVAKGFREVTTDDMNAWKNRRLQQVSPGTVQREINLLSKLFYTGADVWNWREGSPLRNMPKPGNNAPRKRRTGWREVRAICRALGYRTGTVVSKQQEVAFAYLLALRTSLRSAEILQLSDSNVDYTNKIATIARHKTGHKTRQPKVVPLLPDALRLLQIVKGRGRYFTVSSASRDALFRKARDFVGIEDLHFHDARAEILTRLARKVDLLTLSRISGIKDLKVLRDSYYRETDSEIATRVGAVLRPALQSLS